LVALAQLNRTEDFYVLKIHGDIDRIDTIILVARDYRQNRFSDEALKHYFSAHSQT
jgi:hypothetical protein